MTATAMHSATSHIGARLAAVGRVDIDDPLSGARLAVATPAGDPVLWLSYLAGARSVYEAHGVGAALDHDAVVDGEDTTVFFTVLDGRGVCRGGLRAQGPYLRVDESHALEEWAGASGRGDLIRAIDQRLSGGVVEVKTAWVDPTCDDPAAAADLLARLALPMFAVTGVRHIMATSADHSLRRWTSGGGRIDETVDAAMYPDERYRTRLMWWDAETVDVDADPVMLSVMRAEVEQMAAALGAVPALAA